jgi:sugar lactone lactonase YvrE
VITVASLVAVLSASFSTTAAAQETEDAAAAAAPVLPRMITSVTGFDIGDGGPIADAWMSEVHDPIVDKAGNLFFTDLAYMRIRRVDAQTGIVTTVAGNGLATFGPQSHYTDNNVDPTSVTLGAPHSLAIDKAGNLIYAEFDRHRIRYINQGNQPITVYGVPVAAHKVATIGGDGFIDENGQGRFNGDNQPATKASLDFPRTSTLDAAQNIYVGDLHNFRLRKINRATGIITTIAGNGEYDPEHPGEGIPATKSTVFPSGVVPHPDGGFVVADFSGRLRRIDATGIIRTIAGKGQAPFEDGFGGDGGPAIKAKISTNPKCLLFDGDGSLLFTDRGENHGRIRRIDPSGVITTVVGNGEGDPLFDEPAYSTADNGAHPTDVRLRIPGCFTRSPRGFYLADSFNRVLRLVRPGADGLLNGDPSERVSDVSTLGGLREPFRIDVDAAGNVYAGEHAHGRVRRIASNGAVTTIVGTGVLPFTIDGPGGDPRDNTGDGGAAGEAAIGADAGLDIAPNGDLYLADPYTRRVRRVDANGGLTPQSIITTVATLPFPANEVLVAGPDTIYVNDPGHARVWRLDDAGHRTLVAGNGEFDTSSGDGGPATAAAIGEPFGLALDAAKTTLFVASVSTGDVRAVDLSTGVIRTVAHLEIPIGPDETVPSEPVQLAVVGNRFLFIVDGIAEIVYRVDLHAPKKPPVPVAGIGFRFNAGFMGDHVAGNRTGLSAPFGIAVDPGGKVLIADGANNRIRRLGLVDIRPGVFPNVVRAADDVVEVAFLSTYGFDATTLDPHTVRVADGVVALDASGRLRARRVDVDGDGRVDLVVQIDRSTMSIVRGSGEAAVTAQTYSGKPFADADWVSLPA